MRKYISLGVVTILVALVVAGLASAGTGQPAAKATADVSDIALIDPTEEADWTTILSNEIKTPNQKDLFIDVSLECGLYTDTKVDSLGGYLDRAEAEASVQVQVLIDGQPALPGSVTFCKRSQILEAEFMGLLTDEEGNVCIEVTEVCTDPLDPATCEHVVTIDEDCLRPETLRLILETMNANSFNFIAPNLTPGTHTVEVQAKVESFVESTLDSGAKLDQDIDDDDTEFMVDKAGKIFVDDVIVIDEEKMLVTGVADKTLTVERGFDGTTAAAHTQRTRIYKVAGAEATGTIGKGSVTVELVRMIKGEDPFELE
ncbi:MAG: hypothetical protein JSW37_11660 [Anaerolineales bacterium]|nr:MAG: hypothetical protein JSW37_11660 [Anaerolineales bacterium]